MKNKQLCLRLTTKEYKQFYELADSEHKTLSQLIRELLYTRLEAKREGKAA